MTICVFGSLNMDLVIRTLKLPLPGETVTGRDFEAIAGGKGANQALAIQRLGHQARMVGQVGDDDYGRTLLHKLQREKVDISGVCVSPDAHTGIALVVVDEAGGDNQIVLAPGANGKLCDDDVERLRPLLQDVELLLLQIEVPLKTVVAATQLAKEMGIKVILDPAPAPTSLPKALYEQIDIITPNQAEASRLAGFQVSTPADAIQAAHQLQRRGIPEVVVTMGEIGAFCATRDGTLHIPPFPVLVVDPTAAGDAFNAAMAVAMVEGHSFYESLMWGSAAGALTASKPGAQHALPTRGELEEFMSNHVADDPADY